MVTIKGLDCDQLSKLLTPFVDRVTCLECCKLYIAPETAKCGHTYCHACWSRRRTCPACALPLDRRILKLNLQIQKYTDHAQVLNETFDKIFKFKLDEFEVDYLLGDVVPSENECTKNVTEWLQSSQNRFTPQQNCSEPTTQDSTPVLEAKQTSKAQVHSNIKKVISPQKVIHKHYPQNDWEKIEIMPEIEETNIKNCNNSVHLLETVSSINNKEYTMENPRRSSRKRDLKPSPKTHETAIDQHSSKTSSSGVEKQSLKNIKKWGNVKRMKQEFSKLNKKSRSKLNVSIEMCKKMQGTTGIKNKADTIMEDIGSGILGYVIEDNTPGEIVEKEIETNIRKDQVIVEPVSVSDVLLTNNLECDSYTNGKVTDQSDLVKVEKSNNLGAKNNVQINKSHHNNYCDLNFNSCSDNLSKEPVKMPFIKKSALCPKPIETNDFQTFNYSIDCSDSGKANDIEVTIKVGNTVTNIVIKKNSNDVQLNKNVDQEVQTSLSPHTFAPTNNKAICSNQGNVQIEINTEKLQNPQAIKPTPSKKNTASAETVTANYEITESVEKELSHIMECDEPQICNIQKLNNSNDVVNMVSKDNEINFLENDLNIISGHENKQDNDEHLHDLDIFESDSVKEPGVQLLKDIRNTASEILVPAVKSNKIQSQKNAAKRKREESEDIEIPWKKQNGTQKVVCNVSDRSLEKCTQKDGCIISDRSSRKAIENDSENINYDAIMGQVFASIDADINISQKSKLAKTSQNILKRPLQLKNKTQVSILCDDAQEQCRSLNDNEQKQNEIVHEKCSGKVFTVMEEENEINHSILMKDKNIITTQQNLDYLLTPGLFQDSAPGVSETHGDDGVKQICTPLQEGDEGDDDDKSIVEDTPQKNASFVKPTNKPEQKLSASKQHNITDSQTVKSIIDLSDTLDSKNKETTVIDAKRKYTETPLTINKFVDHIKHKSTPISKKSLNFDKVNIIELDDPEQTLCPSSESVAKTTQEKIFMTKAFEKTPASTRILNEKQMNERNFCVAGSCLSLVELEKLKILCRRHNWKFMDTYNKELTHLVVGVDDENKSQRSVKYMCALAASKWIVSFKWVEVCLKTKDVINEEYFEVLDCCGEPAPKRSRIAKRKLFKGITFYCMPPFSCLDVETLKSMIEAAGGQVVDEIGAVRVTERKPALLLAEPENTQENNFTYLAMEFKVVPVNFEWALNCLGRYTLASIFEPLLCPTTLLPSETACWPSELISQDYDDELIIE